MNTERQILWRETFLCVLEHELQMIRNNRSTKELHSSYGDSATGAAILAADAAVDRCPGELSPEGKVEG